MVMSVDLGSMGGAEVDVTRWGRAWLRDRRLAGDRRAGAWTKQRVRRDQLAFLRRHWLRFTIAVLIAGVVIAAVAWRVPVGFWRGLVIGVLGTTVIAALSTLVMQATGSAPRSMGASAEQWTAGELRPLRRQGWTLVNHFGLGRGDIDHIVVSGRGIVVAETKWSADGWDLSESNDRLNDYIETLRERTRRVRLWTGVDRIGLPVLPVIFLWGGPATQREGHELEIFRKVAVVRGARSARELRERLHQFEPRAPEASIDAVLKKVRDELADRDRREAAEHPPRPSFERLYWMLAGCFCAAIAGAAVLLYPLSWGWRWPVLAIAAAAVAGGVLARRYHAVRYFADAWLAGLAGFGIFSVLVFALY